MKRHWLTGAVVCAAVLAGGPLPPCANADEVLPWNSNSGNYNSGNSNAYQPVAPAEPYVPPPPRMGPAASRYGAGAGAMQQPSPPVEYGYDKPPQPSQPVYEGQPQYSDGTYGPDDIVHAGHHFFGQVTTGLASVIEYAFQHNGRPNGYILGEEGGGALVAGLRYGEGTLYTRNAGIRKVYWQGPSIGYDFGGEGSKTMILVYNMHSPDDVYYDYAGVGGQAYVVGGVGINFLKSGPVTMAPIRSGLGLRIGANVGYLKFTREATWNPF